jgi:hypothetical protein
MEQKLASLDTNISGSTWQEQYRHFQNHVDNIHPLFNTHKRLRDELRGLEQTPDFGLDRLASAQEQLQDVGGPSRNGLQKGSTL